MRQRVIKTMDKPLPLSQWLNAPRPDETPVARLDDRIWTLGDLRHDVTQLVDALRQEEASAGRSVLKTAIFYRRPAGGASCG